MPSLLIAIEDDFQPLVKFIQSRFSLFCHSEEFRGLQAALSIA